MNTLKSSLRRSVYTLTAIVVLTGVSAANLSFMLPQTVSAGQISARKLELSSTAPGTVTTGAANSHTNGSSARHTATFTMNTSGATVGAIVMQYCTAAIGTCTAPTGLLMSSVAKGTFTGLTNASWSVGADDISTLSGRAGCVGTNGKTNCVVFKHATTEVLAGTPIVTMPYTAVQNPNEVDGFFVRIYIYNSSTYAANTYGTAVDDGTVASSIVDPINITARVKERLGFSTTASDSGNTAVNAETAACSALTGTGALTLGDAEGVLDSATQYNDNAYFRIYTNAVSGLAIKYSGNTLYHSNTVNFIAAITNTHTETAGAVGGEQFGHAIVNAATGITNVDSSFPGTAGTLSLDVDYDGGGLGTPLYNFQTASVTTPENLATSSGYVTCDTAAVKYVANIAPTTPSGTYTTIITYYAVATF